MTPKAQPQPAEAPPAKPRTKRRWYQFSLRALLVLTTISCVCMGVVAHLKGLTQLQSLDLRLSQVTDAGLVHLQNLAQLQLLHISGSGITDAGIAELQACLPGCEINPYIPQSPAY